jgi:hypothetical protein
MVRATMNFDIHNAPHMPRVSRKRCRKPNVHDFFCHMRANHARTERENVCIIVLSSQSCAVRFMHERTADAFVAIGCDAHPDARTTEDNATRIPMGKHAATHIRSTRRIIRRDIGMRADFVHHIAPLRNCVNERLS